VKQAIAEEVQRQIRRETNEAQQVSNGQELDPASSGLGRMLDNTLHVFVTGTDPEVTNRGGQECPLSPGDCHSTGRGPGIDGDRRESRGACEQAQECVKGDLVSVSLARRYCGCAG
jgi:hypothetical protein